MPSKPFKRSRWFVDFAVQGAIILRVVIYWLCCLVACTGILILWRIAVSGPARPFWTHFDDLWFHYGPVVGIALVLLPVVVMDVLRFSNRFAGPVYRLRRELKRLATGQEVQPLKFRTGDFWREMAEDFNVVARRMQEAEGTTQKEEKEEGELVGQL